MIAARQNDWDDQEPTIDDLAPSIEKLFGRERMLEWRAEEETKQGILAFDAHLGPLLAQRERAGRRMAK
jgi:hypothetical protein